MVGVKEDVLTVALMSKEHHGRVRAVGSHVTPTVYFSLPKAKADKVDIFLSQQEELMETKARLQKLEAAVFKTSASPVDTDEKGSCSAKSEHPVKFSYAEPPKQLFSEEKDDEDVLLVDTIDALQVYLETLQLLVITIAI